MKLSDPRLRLLGIQTGVVGYFAVAGLLVWMAFFTPQWLQSLFTKQAASSWNDGQGYPYSSGGQMLWTIYAIFRVITVFWCSIIPGSLVYGLIVKRVKGGINLRPWIPSLVIIGLGFLELATFDLFATNTILQYAGPDGHLFAGDLTLTQALARTIGALWFLGSFMVILIGTAFFPNGNRVKREKQE